MQTNQMVAAFTQFVCILAFIFICGILLVSKSTWRFVTRSVDDEVEQSHNKLLSQFLLCYLVCSAADWMQGPYVYALYESYGYTKAENAILFVAGFGASAVFGVFAGMFADRVGRRTACILYCALYMLSCILKHFNQYEALMVGRLLGGAATSLLFSSFDTWMVSEHEKRNFDMACVSKAFSTTVYYNSILAVFCGFVAQIGASMFPQITVSPAMKMYAGEYLVPFDISFCLCGLAAVLMWTTWTENYGTTGETSLCDTLSSSMKLAMTNPSISAIGLVSALYEASLYVFIFNWTPVLTPSGASGLAKPSYGLIFALFMLGCMFGSQICERLRESLSAHRIATVTMILATASHAILLISENAYISLLAFLLFEISVGMYFPSVGTVKAEVVPDAYRATIYNIFRVPLNSIVVFALCFHFSTTGSFIITTACLSLCVVCMTSLSCRVQRQDGSSARKMSLASDRHRLLVGEKNATVNTPLEA